MASGNLGDSRASPGDPPWPYHSYSPLYLYTPHIYSLTDPLMHPLIPFHTLQPTLENFLNLTNPLTPLNPHTPITPPPSTPTRPAHGGYYPPVPPAGTNTSQIILEGDPPRRHYLYITPVYNLVYLTLYLNPIYPSTNITDHTRR